jgi:pantoate--beta-alanine ligase
LKLAHKKSEVRHIVADWQYNGDRIALVPTMGALHDGHISLIRQAHLHSDRVVVSVFVNPLQFGPGEDFDQYPRTLTRDVEICRKEGVALVFAPDQMEMYGNGGSGQDHFISLQISKMNEHLCGARRKGHFEGVLQVVSKLFNIVHADVAVFGQKDIQQYYIIHQLVEEYDFPVELIMGPTMRDADGLALSSRNEYLSADERKLAPMLFGGLQRLSDRVNDTMKSLKESGEFKTVLLDKSFISEEILRLEENNFNVDYLSVVSVPDLQPADVIEPGRLYVAAVAAWIGNTRLIDNIFLNG